MEFFKTTDSPLNKKTLQDLFKQQESLSYIVEEWMVKAEDQLLIKVLTLYLGREPKREDFKRVTKYHYPNNPDGYELAYDKVLLGTVKFGSPGHFSGKSEFRIDFTPASSE